MSAPQNNYLEIAPSNGSTAAVQLISASNLGSPGNISIQAVPLDIGGQLIAPRLNLSSINASNVSVDLPIVWGSLTSSNGTILSSPDPTNNPLWIMESATGSAIGGLGYFGLNSIKVDDNLSNQEAGPASALFIQHNYGGSAIQGGRSALLVWLNPQTGTYGLGSGDTNNFYGAATFVATANQSAGGTATYCSSCGGGALYGINPTVSLSNGAQYWSTLAGEEIDVSATGTAVSFVSKVGLIVVLKPTNTLAGGAGVDTAVGLTGNTQPSAGWNYGLTLGGLDGGFPFQPNATLIYAAQPGGPYAGQPSAAWGVDMLGPFFSNGFARSTGFQVDGAGNLSALTANVGNFTISSAGTGLTIAAPAQRATTTGTFGVIHPLGTQYWTIGDKALTAYGGLYEVLSIFTYGATVASKGSGGSASATVTLTTQAGYNGAVCSPYASYTGSTSSTGTLLVSVTPSVVGTCTVLPSGGGGNWPVTSSDGSLTGASLNVDVRVNSVVQLVPDVTSNPPLAGSSVLGTQTACLVSSGGKAVGNGIPGVYRTCGQPLQLPLSFNAANDITLGSAIGTASATAGFTHPFPPISTAPTGTPVNPGVACAWNTSTHVLNCYDGNQWYHISGVANPG